VVVRRRNIAIPNWFACLPLGARADPVSWVRLHLVSVSCGFPHPENTSTSMRGRMGGMRTGDNDLDDDESTGILDLLTRERTTDRRSLLVGLLITALGALIFVARLIYLVTR
jgi:hypothetical protein